MRKILSLFVAICCLISMVGCGSSDPIAPDHNSTVGVPETTAPIETDPNETNPPSTEPTDHKPTDRIPAGPGYSETTRIVKTAYNHLLEIEVVRIIADRKWSDHNISKSNGDQMENVDINPDLGNEPPAFSESNTPSFTADTNYDMSDKKWDLWYNNETGEFVEARLNDGGYGGFNCQVKQDCTYEGETYGYRGYGYSWRIQGARVVTDYESASAGYSNLSYDHLNMIPIMDSLWTITSEDDLYYIVTSQSIVWEDYFLTDATFTFTLKIDKETLRFEEIVVSCDHWTETAVFQYYEDPAQISFYQQFPEEVYIKELKSSEFYHDRSECDDVFLALWYEDVQEAMNEEVDPEYWFTVVEE